MSTDEEKRFQEVLRKFEERIKDPLRMKALASILKLVFYDGLEKKEATDLKIGDILQGEVIKDKIFLAPGGNPIQLSEEVKSSLSDYIETFRTTDSPMTPDSPLFPRYFGESGRKNLDRDLKGK